MVRRPNPPRRARLAWCAWALALSGACGPAAEGPGEPSLGVRLSWLGEGGLPADVASLRVWAYQAGSEDAKVSQHSLSELTVQGGRRRLALPWLPAGVEIRLRVEGLAADGAKVLHVGHIGPFTYAGGEQAVHRVVMVPVGVSVALDSAPMADRFLHTATRLADGRVLIAGGFDAPEPLASCPQAAGLPEGTECYRLEARADAWLYDPTLCALHAVEGGLARPRGGHTASALPGDRALIAGGAASALIALRPTEGGFEPLFFPEDQDGAPGGHDTFEIFVGTPDDSQDPRDPRRGRFVGGGADPAALGQLARRRFLHGAGSPADAPARVLLAGGLDSGDSWELYDDAEPGRTSMDASQPFAHPRSAPAVAALAGEQPAVWIFGGEPAEDNADLAERWLSDESTPSGTVRDTSGLAFPHSVAGAVDAPRPDLSYWRPLARPLGLRAEHAIVVGGFGPRCPPDSATPAFPAPDGPTLTRCPYSDQATNAFLVANAGGETLKVALKSAHAFGAAARLDSGRVIVAGGVRGLGWTGVDAFEVLSLSGAGAQAEVRGYSGELQRARAFHTTTPLHGEGVLSVGGLVRSQGGLELAGGSELYYLVPPEISLARSTAVQGPP